MTTEAGIKLPPDSSGKKVSTQKNTTIYYTGLSSAFKVGDIIVGATSGAQARVYSTDTSIPTGHIHGAQIKGSNTDFIVAENLLVDSVIRAQVSLFDSIYSQSVVTIGANNPNNGQYVDERGASYVRASEGAQQMDSLGRTKTSSPSVLAEYLFNSDTLPRQFFDTVTGDGTIAHEYDRADVLLSVGTASGASVKRVTNRRHKYFVGNGTLVNIVIGCSDAGKVNNYRRWGMYDDEGGLFFELTSAGLGLKVRSSTSGSTVDTAIPFSAVNGDALDGLGVSGFTLDPSKINSYWFDLYLGVRARVGIMTGKGERIVIHEVDSTNAYSYPLVRTAALPFSVENVNTGATDSVSTLRHKYTVVSTEGNLDNTFFTNYGGGLRDALTLDSTQKPVLGIRCASLINTHINRVQIIPANFQVVVEDGNALVQVVQQMTSVTGDTWAVPIGAAEVDEAATSYTGGKVKWSQILSAGTHTIDLSSVYDMTSTSIRLMADGSQGQAVFLTAKKVGAVTPKITATANWLELE